MCLDNRKEVNSELNAQLVAAVGQSPALLISPGAHAVLFLGESDL